MGCKEAGDPEGGVVMTTPQDTGERTGNMIFVLTERQDRLYAQINKKIERLNHRLTILEERGRSE